jgi:hypothetical protein
MSAVTAATAATAALVERSWTGFFLGSGIAFFTYVGWVGTSVAQAICTTAMWVALFGGPAAGVPTAACIAAGAIGALSAAAVGGLVTYGTSQGWTFENQGAEIGPTRRDIDGNFTYPKLFDTNFGLVHNFDAENTKALNLTYGAMLDKHNTTLLHVTWMETFPNGNYTNSPYNGLNMTLGRLVSLNDNGVIRTAIGPTEMLGQILEGFDLFKSSNGSAPPLDKRQASPEVVNWMSFNTYGENMYETAGLQEGLVYDFVSSEEPVDWGVDGWAESFDYYSSKFCLGASPPGDSQGVDSVIVGEVYTNSYGGIDGECDSG